MSRPTAGLDRASKAVRDYVENLERDRDRWRGLAERRALSEIPDEVWAVHDTYGDAPRYLDEAAPLRVLLDRTVTREAVSATRERSRGTPLSDVPHVDLSLESHGRGLRVQGVHPLIISPYASNVVYLSQAE